MWLMKKSLAEAIENARAQALEPPASTMAAFDRERSMASSGGDPRIFKRAGDVAEIVIQGALTPKPDWYAYWMCGGNTTYPEIIQSLALAGADQGIKRIVLNISSPGGYVDGLFDCLAALESFSKPKETLASMADSAAYAIACLGGKITARNKASEFGSVGVCATYVRYDGVEIYDIVSSNAPNKRPDPSTKEGQAVIREGLDAIEELFIDTIVRGRNTTTKDVTKNYGRGAVFLATAALSAGMIDAIAGVERLAEPVEDIDDEPEQEDSGEQDEDGGDEAKRRGGGIAGSISNPAAAAHPKQAKPVASPVAATPQPAPAAPQQNAPAVSGGAPQRKTKHMDLKTLQTEHPELYSAVFDKGKAEGITQGATEATAAERKRVADHLKLGKASGDIDTAHKAIESGASMADMQADYLAASMKRNAVEVRQGETDAAGKVLDGAAAKPAVGKDEEDMVAAELEKLMGPAKKEAV
jgi:ClpP class serine protease